MKQSSLSEIALKLGVNKSKLSYWYSLGLIKPVAKVGRMNIFDLDDTINVISKIKSQKKSGKKLEDIKKS